MTPRGRFSNTRISLEFSERRKVTHVTDYDYEGSAEFEDTLVPPHANSGLDQEWDENTFDHHAQTLAVVPEETYDMF